MQVVKGVYRFSDAPRAWFIVVRGVLKELGLHSCRLAWHSWSIGRRAEMSAVCSSCVCTIV
eukprot:11223867-Lingulodinium_polyedra.AAC.1